MRFKVLPEEADRNMVEGTYMLILSMPRATPEHAKEIIKEIWREAVKLAPKPREGGLLTKRMARCLELIAEYIDDTGMSPTYEELGLLLGMNRGDAHRIVQALAHRGFVETVASGHRGIRVLRRR